MRVIEVGTLGYKIFKQDYPDLVSIELPVRLNVDDGPPSSVWPRLICPATIE